MFLCFLFCLKSKGFESIPGFAMFGDFIVIISLFGDLFLFCSRGFKQIQVYNIGVDLMVLMRLVSLGIPLYFPDLFVLYSCKHFFPYDIAVAGFSSFIGFLAFLLNNTSLQGP